MQKQIDIKNRVVNYYSVDTGRCEEEIIGFLDKQMKVRFHDVYFWHFKYVFLGKPNEQVSNSITVSSYRIRNDDDRYGTQVQ